MHPRLVPAASTLAASSALLAACTSPRAAPPPPPDPRPSVVLQVPSRVEPTFGSGSGIIQLPSRTVLRDRRGDVYRVVRTPRSQTASRMPRLDVTRTTVSHRLREVRVVVSFVRPSTLSGTTLDLGVTTPAGRFFLTTGLPHGAPRLVDPTGDARPCRGADATVDASTGVLSAAVPRGCLGEPDWVSVRVLLSRTTPGGELVENPHNSRSFSAYGTERLYPY